jgi:PKD repeat protein
MRRHRHWGPDWLEERGQSLVEFALVLPIVLLLTMIALDFGRVYLGYINLQNMARIAANFASNNPDAWGTTPDTATQTKYRNQILGDASATNCALPVDSKGAAIVPVPLFTDTNGDGKKDSVGDTVNVQIGCTFQVITPIISGILGNSVAVSSSATFPVKTGISETGGGGSGSAPNAAFTANGIATGSGTPVTGAAPFAVDLRDSSGGNPTSWTWSFWPATSPTVPDPTNFSGQDPGVVTYATAGSYTVSMTAVNIDGTSGPVTMTITVGAATTVDFTATPTSIAPGQTVTFTDASTPGGTAWAWTFGTGEGIGTGATTTHKYNIAGTYTVSLTVTYPAPTGTLPAVVKTNLITVTAPLCTVPSLNGQKINKEQSNQGLWAAAGFTVANLTIGPGVPNGNGNWTIQSQTLVALSKVACSATMQVNDH